MRAFEWPRYRGKTTELLSYMLQPSQKNVIFVTATMAQARVAFSQAKGMALRLGLPEPEQKRFLAASQIRDRDPFNQDDDTRFVFDEADGVLSALGYPVDILAFTPKVR